MTIKDIMKIMKLVDDLAKITDYNRKAEARQTLEEAIADYGQQEYNAGFDDGMDSAEGDRR